MFKKILFLLILAGIGFGIYTGINKIVQMVNTPNEPVAISTPITTGDDVSAKVDISETIDTSDILEDSTPGFFARSWATIKSWFSHDEEETTETNEEVLSGEVLSGTNESLSGENTDDEISTTTGETADENLSGGVLSGSTKQTTIQSGRIEITNTAKKVTSTKKTTTTKTTVSTSSTAKDPLLDSLFR